ncbi:hypothetical protein CFC21_061737 [Triticum aestivum]|uniref:Uncharacterized protein n=4 Tax=Triticinae TaxID=1648030 RepID=A0A453I5T6_AEGTS|nr:uncharacterized protein LOC109732884 [Aegilops tauschii subsp. strangulata]XP_044377885.1 uncharacterized protein LOC123099933 [Triticum aestivum]KAF7053937.1 hypothetical protein CFC21_061737 [Triticum aestivum]
MQFVSPTPTQTATAVPVRPSLRAVPRSLASAERLRMGRAATCTTALRAQCGGRAEPVEARKDGEPVSHERVQEEDEVEQLELLEDEAMAGEDEGRSPTDYGRRAHIFEESSRVFRALKERRDGDGGAKPGAAATRHG